VLKIKEDWLPTPLEPSWISPTTCRAEEAEVVLIPTLLPDVTLSIDVPEDEATLKGSRVPVPWILKDTVEEVAPIPATVPLSMRMPAAVVLAPVALTTKPLVKLPESLLLKLKKSVAWSWPVLVMEAKGRLITKELVEVEILKIVPVVPVETLEITELPEAMVINPGVVVVMVILVPATKEPAWYLVPVLSAMSNWPWTVGAVEVPVPPLVTAKTPETSEEPRAMAPLTKAPVVRDLTGRAEFREVMVEEPLMNSSPTTAKADRGAVVPIPTLPAAVTLNKIVLVEEATEKISVVCEPEPCKAKVALGVVDPIPL
jgi:hypothetical protein